MRRLVRMLVLVVLAVTAGCQGDQPQGEASAPDRGPRPDVSLPPVPQITADRPMRHPDGSLTVWALQQQMSEHLGQDVRVTAYVREIYVCEVRDQQVAGDRMIRERLYLTQAEVEELERARLGTGEGTGPEQRCLYPHMYVADTMATERTLLVTGYGLPLEQRMRVGEQYLIEGRFLEETRGFNRAGLGLVYAFNISGGSLDLPPEGEDGTVRLQ
jgi:hypothetical protein